MEQGRRESNPQPSVLETGALPIELLPSDTRWSRTTIHAGPPFAPAAVLEERAVRSEVDGATTRADRQERRRDAG
ncbi:MAG: hypothetical protein JWN67_1030, partial [Actinomycetia bacterium]|nr:hypothetical protein [Actinomycetes bacterium]